jgi:hypothetical protein
MTRNIWNPFAVQTDCASVDAAIHFLPRSNAAGAILSPECCIAHVDNAEVGALYQEACNYGVLNDCLNQESHIARAGSC